MGFSPHSVDVRGNCMGIFLLSVVGLSFSAYLTLFFAGEEDFKVILVKNVIDHNIAHMEHRASSHEDVDGVDKHEFHGICSDHNAEQFHNEAFQVADTDEDGRLTKKEFAAGMKHASKAFGIYFQKKYMAESKKKMCAIGVYQPVYLDAKGDDTFALMAFVLNCMQFVMWIVSSAGYLVTCPVHTLFWFMMTILVGFFMGILAIVCIAVWRVVRYIMGRPTKVIGDITVADVSMAVAGVVGFIFMIQILWRIYAWCIPEEYVMVYSPGAQLELDS